MALVDYIPVICFTISIVILMRDLYNKMSKGAFALFATGCIDVVCAGALKATYKLLYALAICDFEPLNSMFFPVQSIGFMLAGMGILAMICFRQTKSSMLSVAPPLFSGTFLFIALMVVGLGTMDTALSILAVKLKKPVAIVLFGLSFICSLGMGYLSAQDFTQASMNWIAEGVNVVGQGILLAGVLVLHRNGLEQLTLCYGEKNKKSLE